MSDIANEILTNKKYENSSISEVGQLDLTLLDIINQLEDILAEKREEVKIMKTLALKHYVYGFRDGFRFQKPNPYKDLKE